MTSTLKTLLLWLALANISLYECQVTLTAPRCDTCRRTSGRSFVKHDSYCEAFYECSWTLDGNPKVFDYTVKCCKDVSGYAQESCGRFRGCATIPALYCDDVQTFQCPFKEHPTNSSLFLTTLPTGGQIEQSCPPGSYFVLSVCGCIADIGGGECSYIIAHMQFEFHTSSIMICNELPLGLAHGGVSIVDKALRLNGDEFMEYDMLVNYFNPEEHPEAELTLSFWIKPDGISSEDDGHLGGLVSTNCLWAVQGSLLELWLHNGYLVAVMGGKKTPEKLDWRVQDGKWHHLAFTYTVHADEGNYYKLYADGMEIASVSNNKLPVNSQTAMTLGYVEGLQEDYYFEGYMDELLIYKIALNATEVMNLYTDGAAPEDVLVDRVEHMDADEDEDNESEDEDDNDEDDNDDTGDDTEDDNTGNGSAA